MPTLCVVFTFRYRHQTKSWMDVALFKELMPELEGTFSLEGRSVAQYIIVPHILISKI